MSSPARRARRQPVASLFKEIEGGIRAGHGCAHYGSIPNDDEEVHVALRALQELRREHKKLRDHLVSLVAASERTIGALDEEMSKPSTHERGRRIAQISNFLELAKDRAAHFGLGRPLARHS